MIKLLQGDCMDYMATLPDNAFELAIVDPPYGIGIAKNPVRQAHTKNNGTTKLPMQATLVN
jgi:DNA modification methylase